MTMESVGFGSSLCTWSVRSVSIKTWRSRRGRVVRLHVGHVNKPFGVLFLLRQLLQKICPHSALLGLVSFLRHIWHVVRFLIMESFSSSSLSFSSLIRVERCRLVT